MIGEKKFLMTGPTCAIRSCNSCFYAVATDAITGRLRSRAVLLLFQILMDYIALIQPAKNDLSNILAALRFPAAYCMMVYLSHTVLPDRCTSVRVSNVGG